MDKVIFSKFSYERSREFQIRTDICESESGERYVIKQAGTPDALSHLDRINRSFSLLKTQYDFNSNIQINRCTKTDDKIVLEYLQGDTFETLLDHYYDNGQENKMIEKIRKYTEILQQGVETRPFFKTEEFIKVFGDISFDKPLKSFFVSDIDLIFGNIIVIGDKWNVVDYEWTFEFPIPVDFIFFRAIHYYTVSSRRYRIDAEKLYSAIGITDSDIEKYREMELHFQHYVLGNVPQMYKLHEILSPGEVRQSQLYEEHIERQKEGFIRIYEDYGNGYSEEHAYSKKVDLNETVISIDIPEGLKNLRIDIAHYPGMAVLNGIFDQNGNSKSIKETNGIIFEKDYILFNHGMPSIILAVSEEKTLDISYSYFSMGDRAANVFIGLQNRYQWLCEEKHQMNQRQIQLAQENEDLNRQNEDLSRQNEDLSRQNEDLSRQLSMMQDAKNFFEASYNNICNSRIWRITYPIRRLLDKLKGHR